MLAKKELNTVIETIKNSTMIDDVFAEKNKSKLMDFVKANVEKSTESMRILVDLVNKNYFDSFYRGKYESAMKIARKVLTSHDATDAQVDEFLNTFFEYDKNAEEEVEEEEMTDEEIIENDKIEESEEDEAVEEDDEELDEAVEDDAEIEKTPIAKDNSKNNKEKINQGFDGKITFAARMVLAIALFIGAAIAIKPVKVDLSKYTDSIIASYLEKDEIIKIYNERFEESKEIITADEKEKFIKSISLDTILTYISDNELKDFAGKNNIPILSDRKKQEKLIAKKLSNPNEFYNYYYILFILFSLVVMACCCVAQFDISLLWKFYIEFKGSRGRKEDLESIDINKNKNVREICHAYSESFLQNETYNKTRSNADLYFGGETYFNDMNTFPIQAFLKIIPGTFIGFGILGTFIGFAGGLSSINISDSQSLLNGVQNLLDGLKNAFNTSIVGILASMFLNFVLIHPLFNRLDRCSKILCDYLDTKFFVSEVDAMQVTLTKNNRTQTFPFPQTMGELYTMLEQVASNINQMGATVGDQVTQSVKATLDKTIEKIIKEEIKKLKEEMNSSISLLQECQKHLQNAPVHLKEAAEKMQAAAVNNDELFKRQNQDAVEAYSKVVELSLANYRQNLDEYTKSVEENFRILNDKFGSYAKLVEETSEEMLNIKNTLALMPEDFSNIDKSIQTTTDKLSANQTTLENALSESTQAFDKTTEISESLTEAYESQSKKIEDMISKFTDVLNEYKETSKESKELLAGFKGMDQQIAEIFEHINENTKAYSDVIGNSLTSYLNSFTEATKDVSAKFADATDALREEVEKLNKYEKATEDK